MPVAKLHVPQLVTNLGSGNSYCEAHRVNGWSASGIHYALAGAVGSSSTSTQGVWVDDTGTLHTLTGGSGHTAAVQASAPSGSNSIGDIVGFTSSSGLDIPCLWPETGSFTNLLGLSGQIGRANRTNDFGLRIGYVVLTGSGALVPFEHQGSSYTTNFLNLLGSSSYSQGEAQAIGANGNVAGWVDDGTGQRLCFWEYDSFGHTYGNPVPLSTGLYGVASHIYESGGQTIVLGYDTVTNKPFRWEGTNTSTTSLMRFGKAGEMEQPTQASENGYAGAFANNVQPCFFAIPLASSGLADGVGCADDILAIMAPTNPSQVTSSTTATGLTDTTLGGTDFGSGKLWIAPQSDTYWLSFFRDLTINIGTNDNSASEVDTAFVDGLFMSVKKGIGGVAGEVARATFDHELSPSVGTNGNVFRVTSRVQGTYELWVQFYNWSSQTYSSFIVAGTIHPYMQTLDVSMNNSAYFSSDPNPRVLARVSVRNGSSAVSNPHWDIEQALVVSW